MNSPLPVLDRQSFFGLAPALRYEDVEVSWGGIVRVRQITAGERDRFEAGVYGKDKGQVRASLLVACCVDAEGRPLFTVDDLPTLSGLPVDVVEPIINAAYKLNAITSEDVDRLEKNSGAAPSGP